MSLNAYYSTRPIASLQGGSHEASVINLVWHAAHTCPPLSIEVCAGCNFRHHHTSASLSVRCLGAGDSPPAGRNLGSSWQQHMHKKRDGWP